MQKSEHDQCVHAEFVAKHALHLEGSDATDRDIIDDRCAKIDANASGPFGGASDGREEFDNGKEDKDKSANRHRHLLNWVGTVQHGKNQSKIRGRNTAE